jgi:hypothetical protein
MECPKKLFIECDLVQAEWVVTAYLAQDANMLRIIENKLDPHLTTAVMITGAPIEFLKLEDKCVGKQNDPDEIEYIRRETVIPQWTGKPLGVMFLPRIMSARQLGKKCNHGLNYNMQYRRFSLETELAENEAKICVNRYHDAYRGLKRYYRMVEEELRSHSRILTNCFGYKRQFIGNWDNDLLDASYAFKPQSTVGRVGNLGLRGIYYDTSLKRVDPILNAHDSILNQAWPRSWEELAHMTLRIDAHMTTDLEYNGVTFTLRREFKIGPNWEHMSEVKLGGDVCEALRDAWEQAEARRLDSVVPRIREELGES